jgi:hypothetical protein
MDSPARRRSPHRVALSPFSSPEALVAGDDVRLYFDTHHHTGRLTAAALSLATYPHWARPWADSEKGVQ